MYVQAAFDAIEADESELYTALILAIPVQVRDASPKKAIQFDQQDLGVHFLSQFGKVKELIVLLNKGMSPNQRNKSQGTPLHFSAWTNQIGAMQILLRYGGDINAVTNAGQTPLDKAEVKGHK